MVQTKANSHLDEAIIIFFWQKERKKEEQQQQQEQKDILYGKITSESLKNKNKNKFKARGGSISR